MENIKHLELQDTVVIGVSAKTSPQTALEVIPKLWQRFFEAGLAERLPQSADDRSIYAVYSDYEGDYSKPYMMTIGVAVPPQTPVPEGLKCVLLDKGRYAQFHAEGPPERALWEVWSFICERWPERAQRRYQADFERYAPEEVTPGRVSAEVFVGVR